VVTKSPMAARVETICDTVVVVVSEESPIEFEFAFAFAFQFQFMVPSEKLSYEYGLFVEYRRTMECVLTGFETERSVIFLSTV